MAISGINDSLYNYNTELYKTMNANRQAGAMGNMPKPPDSDQMVSDLSSKLNLTDEQKTKLKEILEKNKPDSNSSGTGTNFDPSTMKSKMDDMDDEIMSILSSDQKSIFQDMIDTRESQMANRQKEGYY